ncbi:unnamed protein product [Caenorhabditis auriculariae]|uniref:G-protein coupled receptors family 1 profile domain-containing protein n=1 Tax=Caenorhabditis auriculariae TaxID=2777116 RepID=A0A8S1H5K6_9PELO|nr:unnamed protein product [Caenorhabditis auriculariae]
MASGPPRPPQYVADLKANCPLIRTSHIAPSRTTRAFHDIVLHVILDMEAFCNPEKRNSTDEFGEDLRRIEVIFAYAQLTFCIIGVTGNILNLRTLQSPSLQTVPFMYIRSLAVFDLISLSCIIFFILLSWNGECHGRL